MLSETKNILNILQLNTILSKDCENIYLDENLSFDKYDPIYNSIMMRDQVLSKIKNLFDHNNIFLYQKSSDIKIDNILKPLCNTDLAKEILLLQSELETYDKCLGLQYLYTYFMNSNFIPPKLSSNKHTIYLNTDYGILNQYRISWYIKKILDENIFVPNLEKYIPTFQALMGNLALGELKYQGYVWYIPKSNIIENMEQELIKKYTVKDLKNSYMVTIDRTSVPKNLFDKYINNYYILWDEEIVYTESKISQYLKTFVHAGSVYDPNTNRMIKPKFLSSRFHDLDNFKNKRKKRQ